MLRKAGDASGHKPVAVAFACVFAFEFLPVFAEKFVVVVIVVVIVLVVEVVVVLVLVLVLVLFVLLVVVFLNSRMVQARALVLFSSTVILICYRNTFASFKAIPAESWRFLFRFRPGKHSNVSTKRRLRADASSSGLQEFWSENYHVRSLWIASVFFPRRSIRTLASFQEKNWWKFIQPFANGQTSRRLSENMQKLRKKHGMKWRSSTAGYLKLAQPRRGRRQYILWCKLIVFLEQFTTPRHCMPDSHPFQWLKMKPLYLQPECFATLTACGSWSTTLFQHCWGRPTLKVWRGLPMTSDSQPMLVEFGLNDSYFSIFYNALVL